jgi:hypothetical protein
MRGKVPTLIRRDFFTGPIATFPALAKHWHGFAKRLGKYHHLVCTVLGLAPGSREHFYHFLLGYLLPVVHAQAWQRFSEFRVLDCGPLMTPILRQTLQRLGHHFEIVPVTQVENPLGVESWDCFHRFNEVPEQFADIVNLVRRCWSVYECPAGPCELTENLIIKRSPPHQFYLNGGAEVTGNGTSRRGITNLEEISEFLKARGLTHTVYDASAHCLGCQIKAFSNANRIIGIRGADWANVIWSRRGLKVKMYDPTPPAKTISALFLLLGVQAQIIPVPQRQMALNSENTLGFFTAP